MNLCKKVTDLLPLFINGGLTEKEQNFVANHISECSECEIKSREYDKIKSLCRQEKHTLSTSYGSELVVKINNRLEKDDKRKKLFLTLIPVSATVVTVFLITFFTIFKTSEFQNFDLLFSEDTELISELTNTSLFSSDYIYYSDEIQKDVEEFSSDDYINFSTEYIVENSTSSSDDYTQALASLDDDCFEEIINEIKSVKL